MCFILEEMATGGRLKDPVRCCFENDPIYPHGRKTPILNCRGCGEGISAVVVRLRNHASSCTKLKEKGLWTVFGPPKGQTQLRITKTNKTETERVHQALARFIFSANLPFSTLDSPYLKKLMNLCRPGMQPLTKYTLTGRCLEEEFHALSRQLAEKLAGALATFSLDGWTAPGNLAALGTALDDFFLGLKETFGQAHTAEFLTAFTKAAIQEAERDYKVGVVGVVTDNASNMALSSGLS